MSYNQVLGDVVVLDMFLHGFECCQLLNIIFASDLDYRYLDFNFHCCYLSCSSISGCQLTLKRKQIS